MCRVVAVQPRGPAVDRAQGAVAAAGVGLGGPGAADAGPSVADSAEEREPGVASVSAAVYDRLGVVVAAVSLSGPVERLTRHPLERFGAQVQSSAAQVAAALAQVLPIGPAHHVQSWCERSNTSPSCWPAGWKPACTSRWLSPDRLAGRNGS